MAETTEMVEVQRDYPQEKHAVSYTVAVKAGLDEMAQAKLDVALSIEITDSDMFEMANMELADAKKKIKMLEGLRKSATDPVKKAIDEINGIYSDAITKLSDAVGYINKAVIAYHRAQERKAAEAKAAAEKAAQEERDRIKREAKALEDAGKVEEARAHAAIAEMVVAPPAAVAPAKAPGLTIRKTWKARVVDRVAFAKYIAENLAANPNLDLLWEPTSSALNDLARAQGGMLKIPGVECYESETTVNR